METTLLLANPVFEYGIPQCPQRPIVLHAIYVQKNLGEAEGYG